MMKIHFNNSQKKALLSVLFVMITGAVFSQMEFAPIGAEWYFSRNEGTMPPDEGYTIYKVAKDSIIEGKTVRVIRKTYHHADGVTVTDSGNEYLYEEDNKVYWWKNQTFYLLYNFNAQPGESWTVYGEDNMGDFCSYDSLGVVVVDSVKTIKVNGYDLKALYTSPGVGSDWGFNGVILEHIGCVSHIFPHARECAVDVPYENGPLRCYEDSVFGKYKSYYWDIANYECDKLFYYSSDHSHTSLLKPDKIWSVRHENTAWHVHPDDPYPYVKTSWYKTDGDTLIGNMEYKHLLISEDSLQLNWTRYGAIREDGMQVYYHNYSEEVLLYDFDVKVNDTITLENNHFVLNYVLDSVGVYYVENSGLKMYFFSVFTTQNSEREVNDTWIEGIGSLSGLLHNNCFFVTPCEDFFQLLCIHENNSLLYSNPDFEACYYRNVTATETYPENIVKFEIFPNPAKNLITYFVPSDVKIGSIEMRDFSGKVIQKWNLHELADNRLNIRNYSPGVYLLKAETNNGIFVEKLIIQ